MKGPVHYVAHGKNGLSFECFHRELFTVRQEGTELPPVQPGWPPRIQLRQVRRTTSVDKVTCPACLQALRVLLSKNRPAKAKEKQA